MPPEVIERDANETHVPPGQGDKTPPKDETVTISKAELEGLRRENQERGEAARYWAGVARTSNGNGAAPAEAAGEPEYELDASEFLDADAPDGLTDDTPEKLVDEFAAQGVNALKKRGFITAADAQRIAVEAAGKVAQVIMGRERQKRVTDDQLLGQFPELRDQNSELFKETAKIYREAVTMDPSAKKTPAALFLSAKAAKQMITSRGPNDEDEQDRLDRINAQDGRTRGRTQVQHDDLLGEEAKTIISAMGISEDDYKAEKAKLAGSRPVVRRGR